MDLGSLDVSNTATVVQASLIPFMRRRCFLEKSLSFYN